MDIIEKENQLVTFIKTLAGELCREIVNNPNAFSIKEEFYKFIKIYNGGYRHSYNRIFIVLNDIRKETKNPGESTFINITANYEYIQEEILPQLKKINQNQYKNAVKFFDHLLLEISRIEAWTEFDGKIEDYNQRVKQGTRVIDEHEKQMSEMVKQTKADVETEINSIKYETDKIKTDFITILSIFVAIIMGFAGVVGLGGNIMANLNNIIIYKAIFMMLVSGLILFNGIFLMLHIVAKLTGRSIAHNCVHYSPKINDSNIPQCQNKQDCDSCSSNHCRIWKKVKIKFPYTAQFNQILLYGLAFTLIAWIFNHGSLGWAVNNDFTYIIIEHRIGTYLFIVICFLVFCYFLKSCRTKDS